MTVPGNLSSPLLAVAAAGGAATANITKSVRFNSADSAYLNRTPSSASNRQKYTWSTWVKRSSTSSWILTVGSSADTESIYFNGGHLVMARYVGSFQYYIETEASFLDFSSWYSIVIAHDHSLSTSTDRIKLYVNGVRITDFKSGANFPPQNSEYETNSTENHKIGRYANAYLADLYFIDGQQLDPTSFGAYDSNGVWQASSFSGSFGTNGFHLLDFASESTVGHDSSGNENDFTANNINASQVGSNAVLGNFANGWSGSLFSGAKVNSFDGQTGTLTAFGSGGGSWSGSITAQSSLEVFYILRGSSTFTINSTSLGLSEGWTTLTSQFSFPLTITSMSMSQNSGNGPDIRAMKVDGKFVIDNSLASSYPYETPDVLRDVPVNGDSSDDTGAGGELSSNYCVLNSVDQKTATLTNGALDAQIDSDGSRFVRGTIAVSSGKWYWEFTTLSSNNMALGVVETTGTGNLSDSGSYYYYANGGALYGNSSGKASSWGGSTLAVNDVLGVALDMDNGTLQYYKNGSLIGTAWTGLTGKTLAPAIGTGGGSSNKTTCNFGQRAFAYGNAGTNRPAATFKALCTSNLPTPTIADGSNYFNAITYTGDAVNDRTITTTLTTVGAVWIKRRDVADNHRIGSVVQGGNAFLSPNLTGAENNATSVIRAFSGNTFDIGTDTSVNASSGSHIAWAWDAGTSNASNTDGSITSSCRTNIASGTSIVTWTGTGAAGTVGHNLGVKPEFIFTHRRSGSGQWPVYHSANGATKYQYLNSTIEARTYQHFWNNTEPTSSVFSIGSDADVSTNGGTHIAYCFAPVAGFSAVGSYSGNGSADGSFVHLGFRPRWLLIKTSSHADNWRLWDSARKTYNATNTLLFPDSSIAEITNTAYDIDFLSNGFKLRTSNSDFNGSGKTVIYIAFAENPFQANGGLAR